MRKPKTYCVDCGKGLIRKTAVRCWNCHKVYLKTRDGYTKGKPCSEETKSKLSIIASEAMKNPERKEKLRLSNVGKIPWNKGIHTPFSGHGFKKGHTPWIAGKHHTAEALKIMSEKSKSKNPHYWLGKKKPHMSGEKCHLWKGGVTLQNHAIRTSLEFQEWRKSCYDRDNYTCQKTGVRGGILHVHHIESFHCNHELRYDVNNGITLSASVHYEFHNTYGFTNNTKEQFQKFMMERIAV
jgi:hypothetical protein